MKKKKSKQHVYILLSLLSDTTSENRIIGVYMTRSDAHVAQCRLKLQDDTVVSYILKFTLKGRPIN